MIEINLLPQEEQRIIHFKQKKIPLIPALLVLFSVMFIVWIVLLCSITISKAAIFSHAAQLNKIAPQKATVDTLWDEVNNRLKIQQDMIAGVMIRKFEWAQVLNIISDYTSQGVWLVLLDVDRKDDYWLVTVSGYAKPVTAQSMIKEVGDYMSNVKDALEASFLKKQITEVKDLKDFIEVSTTTKRKRAQSIELTEFTATFKINEKLL